MLVFWFSGILNNFSFNSFVKYQLAFQVYTTIWSKKNALQELVMSAKKDQASCEIEDWEQSASNRENGRFKKKKSFLDTPQTPVMTGDRKTNLVFQKLKVGWRDKKYEGQIK